MVSFRQLSEWLRARSLIGDGVVAGLLGVAWVLGVRNRRERIQALEDCTEMHERERVDQARRAIVDERTRIARELHDVIAHGMSVMVVQAGAARSILETRPDEARTAMASIESIGRQSLDEMRRLLEVLGAEDESSFGRVPQPSLAHLDVFVDQCREAGLPVELAIEGDPRPLPPGVDLAAYRIVQEALSNALSHAGRANAAVRLCYGQDVVEVWVTGDGHGVIDDTDAFPADFGLVAMRERVNLYDGELHMDEQPGGGFAVRARLPLEVQS